MPHSIPLNGILPAFHGSVAVTRFPDLLDSARTNSMLMIQNVRNIVVPNVSEQVPSIGTS